MARSWSGAAQSGSREYEPADIERVLDVLPCGRQNAVTTRTFADMLRMHGRTVRAVLSARDGVDFLLAYDGDLFWVAESFEESVAHTEHLRGQGVALLERVARRERYARATLPRRQPELIPS